MQDNDRSILEKYEIDVNGTRKVRGAVLCDAVQGLFLLKEVSAPAGRVLALCELYAHLEAHGYKNVDSVVRNREGEAVTVREDGKRYMLRRWFAGRECDVKKPGELLVGAGNLAKLHAVMQMPSEDASGCPSDGRVEKESVHSVEERLDKESETSSGGRVEKESVRPLAERLDKEYERHDRELRKVRKFIRTLTLKGDFEITFLQHFDAMYQWAKAAGNLLAESEYDGLYEESMRSGAVIHGEYNYHNLLMSCDESRGVAGKLLATVNFDKHKQDVQVADLYYFLRKTMEKHGWKERLGDGILNAYSAIHPLSRREMEYLKIRLAYPEKFWKIANSYYHSNKAWMSIKNMEKLYTAIRQTKEKERFIDNIFAFHL